jgi:hypothetical protein
MYKAGKGLASVSLVSRMGKGASSFGKRYGDF